MQTPTHGPAANMLYIPRTATPTHRADACLRAKPPSPPQPMGLQWNSIDTFGTRALSCRELSCCFARWLFYFTLQWSSVNMEMFVWLEVMTDQVEWKFAIITHGELFVMIDGMSRMLEWFADNLDYPQSVSITTT